MKNTSKWSAEDIVFRDKFVSCFLALAFFKRRAQQQKIYSSQKQRNREVYLENALYNDAVKSFPYSFIRPARLFFRHSQCDFCLKIRSCLTMLGGRPCAFVLPMVIS